MELPKQFSSYWNGVSALLADTSEENHLNVNIVLNTSEDMGLSENDKNVITEIWQHPVEGIITFKFEGCEDEFDLSDFDKELIEQVFEYLFFYELFD